MCGIVGVVGPGVGRDDALLRAMTASLSHRGPDDSGWWSAQDVILGHRRLSILDLSAAGRQPMVSADGRYRITYNGEIYNYLELKELLIKRGYVFQTATDTEVLLAAYREWGKACLERLNGMWAFAIWDQKEHKLFASRDRFGEKPFYFVQHLGKFYFASEMKALFLIPNLTRSLDPGAVMDFCTERMSDHTEQTFIREIHQLLPASYLTWKESRLEIKRYWSLPPDEEREETHSFDPERILTLLDDAVRLRLRADVPVGCLLSGGLDSSTIACLIRKNWTMREKIHLFITLTEPPSEEVRGVEWVLRQGGFEAHFHKPTAKLFWEDLPKLLWHQEQPFADGSMAAHFALMREARKSGVPVLLTGQGGDEVFAGYPTFLWVYLAGEIRQGRWASVLRDLLAIRHQRQIDFRRIIAYTLPGSLRAWVRGGDVRRKLNWVNPEFFPAIKDREIYAPVRAGRLSQYLKGAIHHWSLPGFLHYEDRNAMAFGVETRLPFLDHRLVEEMFRLPSREKLRGGQTKSVLRRAVGSLVPEEIIQRQAKQGYPAPLGAWLRSLSREITEVAHSSVGRDCPILNSPVWSRLVDGFLKGDHTRLEPVWRGLICALWYDQIFKMPDA